LVLFYSYVIWTIILYILYVCDFTISLILTALVLGYFPKELVWTLRSLVDSWTVSHLYILCTGVLLGLKFLSSPTL